jgi:methyltransferase (TIGR00027 family)
MMAAVTRGCHRLDDPPPWIIDDPFALLLVGPEWQEMADDRRQRYPEEVDRQVRAAVIVRSRYAEERLQMGHFTQYVILGAGLDSFAWRRPDLVGPLRLFEVDHPASQAWKRQRVGDLGLPVSDEHVLTPIDFEVQSLRDGLDDVRFDWNEPALFAWLGVVPYLTQDAVDATLRTVAMCASGSEIVLEYGVPDCDLDDVGRQFRDAFLPIATLVGEPVHTRWSAKEAEQHVLRCGLRVADHPSRSDIDVQFFAGRTDGLRVWTNSRLIAASVP